MGAGQAAGGDGGGGGCAGRRDDRAVAGPMWAACAVAVALLGFAHATTCAPWGPVAPAVDEERWRPSAADSSQPFERTTFKLIEGMWQLSVTAGLAAFGC